MNPHSGAHVVPCGVICGVPCGVMSHGRGTVTGPTVIGIIRCYGDPAKFDELTCK